MPPVQMECTVQLEQIAMLTVICVKTPSAPLLEISIYWQTELSIVKEVKFDIVTKLAAEGEII